MGRSTRARRRPTYADLVAKLRDVESRLGQLNALERVQHDLATHQEELEIQNQKLRESRKEIEQSHDRYVDLFDLAPVGYATLDEKGLVCDMNLRASTLLETERLRQVGMPFFVHVLQEDRRTYLDYFARCKRATERSEIEIRLRTRTGTIVPVLLTTRRCSASGAATRYSTAMIDLRERHRAEAARRRAEEERQRVLREHRAAEAANATKDRFIAVLSHELRTPLTPVLIMLESAQHRGLVSDQLRPMFDLMRRSIELEARLIDDLLDVTRIRQGKLRLDRETINLHALIAEVLETYRPQVEADGLTVEARLSARATWLRADPDRIRQVIWNLLQNALRNTPAAGAIELETRDGVPGMVVVRVRDNGRGMTPDVLDRVFQPFEQWPDRRGGLGLGLSICRGLVEAHGGRIIAASPGVGRGSTFEVELPTTPQPDISAVAPAHVSERAPEHGLRVLVVEDNQDTASALVELLELYGFEVRHAPTLECARRMATSDVDVIVSDLGLPDGSGLELLENARRPVRAIALSGYGMAEDVERSLAAGFTLHLTKPVAPDDLVEAIRRVANQ